MNIEVAETVEAPAETPEVVDTLEAVDAPEVSDDDALGDIYDQMTAEPVMETPDRDASGRFVAKDGEAVVDEVVAAVEIAEDVDGADLDQEAAPVESDAPSYLPQEVRDGWAKLPEGARNAFAKSQQEMSAKLADMGRRAQGFEPIAQAVTNAAQQFPELMNKTPDQIAKDVFELAHTQVNLQRDPVGTMMQIAQQMGVLDQLGAKFNGQAPQGNGPAQPYNPQMENIKTQQEIAQLKQQLQNANNPANIQQVVTQEIATRDANTEVLAFASGKEHWAAVEPALPKFIQAAQATRGEGASNTDILQAAYDMAINAYGLKATPATPEKAVVTPNPKRTEAVIKAKSANVTSRSSKSSPVSEMDALGSVYDRMMSS